MKFAFLNIILVAIASQSFAQVLYSPNASVGNNTTNLNVGVGTGAPEAKLEVKAFQPPNGVVKITLDATEHGADGSALIISPKNFQTTGGPYGAKGNYGEGLVVIKGQTTWHDGIGWREDSKAFNVNNQFFVQTRGCVGIGTDYVPNGYKLSIFGKAIMEGVTVKIKTAWPDYVFIKGYQLRPLVEVEKYLQTNQHLPDVPSAAEVERDGINLEEMDAVLLKKIEELTLYLIEQNKKLEEQQQKSEAQQKEIEALKQQSAGTGKKKASLR